MRRGEIWWANLGHPRKSRPVLLLTRDGVYSIRTHVTVAPITRSARDRPFEVPIGQKEGLRSESVINLDDITTIAIADLDRFVTALSPAKMASVANAIRHALDLD